MANVKLKLHLFDAKSTPVVCCQCSHTAPVGSHTAGYGANYECAKCGFKSGIFCVDGIWYLGEGLPADLAVSA